MKKLLLSFAGALSLAFCLDHTVSAQSTARAMGSARVADFPAVRIDNFGRINDNYYRGAQPRGRDYSDLAAFGVKAIVDLTDDDSDASEPSMARNAGLKFFKLPMNTHRVPTIAELTTFLTIVEDPVNQPVYVHCVGGKHRTGVMTAVYRMTEEGWTAAKAFNEMKQYKFGADFLHPEFKNFVYSYKPPVELVQIVRARAPQTMAAKASS